MKDNSRGYHSEITPFYRETQKLEELHISFDDGGIGDNIARLPVIPYMLDHHPHLFLYLWVPVYFEDLAKRMLGKHERLRIYNYNRADKAKPNLGVKKFTGHHYTNLSSHMTEHAFHTIVNSDIIPIEYKNYLKVDFTSVSTKKLKLPEKYVVVTTGYTANCREMKGYIVNEICDYLIEKGYTPVFLGKHETEASKDHPEKIIGTFDESIDFSKGIDLRDRTSLTLACMVISQAKTIVGLDNGLLHLAACTDIPIVSGFTNVNPSNRAPYRHDIKGWEFYPVVLTQEELVCNFCQSNCTFTFNHSFKECMYGDLKCLDMLDASKYIAALDKIL